MILNNKISLHYKNQIKIKSIRTKLLRKLVRDKYKNKVFSKKYFTFIKNTKNKKLIKKYYKTRRLIHKKKLLKKSKIRYNRIKLNLFIKNLKHKFSLKRVVNIIRYKRFKFLKYKLYKNRWHRNRWQSFFIRKRKSYYLKRFKSIKLKIIKKKFKLKVFKLKSASIKLVNFKHDIFSKNCILIYTKLIRYIYINYIGRLYLLLKYDILKSFNKYVHIKSNNFNFRYQYIFNKLNLNIKNKIIIKNKYNKKYIKKLRNKKRGKKQFNINKKLKSKLFLFLYNKKINKKIKFLKSLVLFDSNIINKKKIINKKLKRRNIKLLKNKIKYFNNYRIKKNLYSTKLLNNNWRVKSRKARHVKYLKYGARRKNKKLWNKKLLFFWKVLRFKNKLKIKNNKIIIKKLENKKIIQNLIYNFYLKTIKINGFYNKYLFKSFKWKFFRRKWHLKYSKWKNLNTFKLLMSQAWNNFRKINKNFIFLKLFKLNFYYFMGLNEKELFYKWIKLRKNNNGNLNIVNSFNSLLQLKLDGLSMWIGIVPNRFIAKEFIKYGGMRINSLIITDPNYFINTKDIIQVNLDIKRDLKKLYSLKHWNNIKLRLYYSNFLMINWPLLLFMFTRLPNNYELLEDNILNLRWVRFFIRYFPIKLAKYRNKKIKWYKY